MISRPIMAVVALGVAAALGSCGDAEPTTGDAAPTTEEVAAADEVEAGAEEATVSAAQEQAETALERALAAEARAVEAEQRAADAEARANDAEARAATAQRRVTTLKEKVDDLTAQLEAAEAAAADAASTTVPATTAPPTPSDPYLIPAGVIEDGHHVGFLVSRTDTSFSFDMAEIRPDGSWKNENPRIRTLPMSPTADHLGGALPGTPIQLYVVGQHVQWVGGLAG